MPKNVVALVGSYRKGGVIDSLVTKVLAAAEAQGAQTSKIYLIDKNIEFCANCRQCTQAEGEKPGRCRHDDDMPEILAALEKADAIVLGAPVNFFNVTAVFRRFMERLVCFAYWPWGKQGGPTPRHTGPKRPAVLVTSSAMPGFIGRVFTGAPRALRITAETLGAKPVASLFVGLAAVNENAVLPEKAVRRATKAGRKLVS